jgi:hypothetical protein
MAYTDKQVQHIVKLRDSGLTWVEVEEAYNKKFKQQKSWDNLRRAARNNTGKPAANQNSCILCISDLHAPFNHPDAINFVKAVADKYQPTRVIVGGDEVDHHAMSFHDSDPDLPAAGDELLLAINKLRPLYDIFPVVDVLESNHGSMSYRKGKYHGIPRKYLRDYGDVLDAPKGWTWHIDMTITLPTGVKCYLHHGLVKDIDKLVKMRGMCAVQFHYHEDAQIIYISNPENLLWGLQCGCLIDKRAMAFAYNKTNLKRPILSLGVIKDGYPLLIPMVLNKNGRWIGRLV